MTVFACVCKFTYSSKLTRMHAENPFYSPMSYLCPLIFRHANAHTRTSNQQTFIEPWGLRISCFHRSKFREVLQSERKSSTMSEVRESRRLLLRMLWDKKNCCTQYFLHQHSAYEYVSSSAFCSDKLISRRKKMWRSGSYISSGWKDFPEGNRTFQWW